MNKYNPTLTDEKVLTETHTMLSEHLELAANGYKCSSDDLYHVLLGVAANQGTIEAVCADLVGTPDPQTIRDYINEQICVDELAQLEAQLNKALVEHIPPRTWRRPQDIAMDIHDRPYYGKARLKRKGCGCVDEPRTERPVSIALPPPTLSSMVCVLHWGFALFCQMTRRSVSWRNCSSGSKGCTFGCVACCWTAALPVLRCNIIWSGNRFRPSLFVLFVARRGGRRALCRGRKGYRTRYVFKNAKTKLSRTADLVVCRVFTTAKRTKRLKRRATWWIFILIHLDLSPRQVRRLYRRRFGIETSYRCAAQVRGWTTSPNAAYRFLLMALGLFLLNVWMILRWHFTQIPRRGGRKLDTRQFQLSRFAKFIVRALEHHYGYVRSITAVAVPLS